MTTVPRPRLEGAWGQCWCVLGGVLLSRTLAGAVPSALSGLASGFGMGIRAFPCRCDHRDDCVGSAGLSSARVLDAMWLFVSGRPLLDPHSRALCACVLWLVVGLGVDRIVDALRLLLAHPLPSHARAWCVWW